MVSAAGIIQIWKNQTPTTKAKRAAELLGTLSQHRIRLNNWSIISQLPLYLIYLLQRCLGLDQIEPCRHCLHPRQIPQQGIWIRRKFWQTWTQRTQTRNMNSRKFLLVECGKLELRLSCPQIFLLPRLEGDEGSPHPTAWIPSYEQIHLELTGWRRGWCSEGS